MKNILSALLTGAMLFAVSACSGSSALPVAQNSVASKVYQPQQTCVTKLAMPGTRHGMTTGCCVDNVTTCSLSAPQPPVFISVPIGFGGGTCIGACGGGGGGGGGGITVAYQGPALPGKPCLAGAGANSAPVGFPMGKTDTGTGPNGDEVKNVYLVNVSFSTGGGGSVLGNGGFLLTTFGGQTWYQLPVSVPAYNGAVYIDLGNVSVANNASWGTSNLINEISSALSSSSNSGLSGALVSEIKSELANIAAQGTNASTPDCFSGGDWNGITQA